jgi:predicted enzyme related to lactoylglutathione lyase
MWQAPNQLTGGALTAREEGFTQPRSMVEVDSIDEVVAKATANGGTLAVEKTPITEGSWWALLRDPDGNEIGLFEGEVQM